PRCGTCGSSNRERSGSRMERQEYARGSRRTARVAELVEGQERWIAGRLLRDRGVERLADETGAVPIELRAPDETGAVPIELRTPGEAVAAEHGDVVEARGRLERGRFAADELRVLVRGLRRWPERPVRGW